MFQPRLASCMAENSESFCQAVACYIEKRLGIRTEYVTGIPWQERERMFDRGEIRILWLCGYPHVHKVDMAGSDVELLAVPVPRGERYRGRPVYFSDVIVRRERPFQSFLDLRGDVRNLLLCMHGDVNGGGMLARAGLERFVEAQDHDYDLIRAMARKAEQFFRFSDLATPGISPMSQSC